MKQIYEILHYYTGINMGTYNRFFKPQGIYLPDLTWKVRPER